MKPDVRIISLVGAAHGISHFYHLILVALFAWIQPAFQLSFAQLGLLMTVFFVVSGVGQALSGFIVDRVGARTVLFCGLGLLGTSSILLGFAPSYGFLLAGSVVAGMGNAVFHPADYSLLNQRVSKGNLAHAFSVHGITGNLGWAAAPVFLGAIAAWADWRTALFCASVLPFTMLAVLALALEPDAPKVAAATSQRGGATDFMRVPGVWMCFAFFFLTAVALSGIQGFSASVLTGMYKINLALATAAFTAYMLASAVGMVIGGFLAARTTEHDRTITIAFSFSALMALLLAANVVPGWMALVLMGLIGFGAGIAGPSRDLLIRAAAPKDATGRVFGVVYSGLDSGLALGPLLFGKIMDAGHLSWVFVGVAIFQALAIATARGVKLRETSGDSHALRNHGPVR